VVNGIHRGHHSEEHLGRADVARRFVAADVLLAGLEREAIRRVAVRVFGNADEPARHEPLVGVASGHEGSVRSAEAERHTEALGISHGDVGTELTRRSEEGQREEVGRDDGERAGSVRFLHDGRVVAHCSRGVRILEEHGEGFDRAEVERGIIGDDDLDSERLGAGLHDIDRLRVTLL
jgi:hypothetical protein